MKRGNKMPPKRDVECTCQYCGKVFPKRPSEIRKGEGKFCSKECGNKSRIKIRPTKPCTFCGKEFSSRHSESKFCSLSCKASYYALQTKKRKVIKCNFCEKEFEQEKPAQKSCSQKCAHALVKTRVKKNCVICNSPFEVKNFYKDITETCSKTCYLEWKRRLMLGNELALGMRHTQETKDHLRDVFRAKFQDPAYAEWMFERWGTSPNKLETYFDSITPDEVVFKGDGKFFLTFKSGKVKNPDFVVAHQRKVIELYGDYWHEGEDPEELIARYKEIGFECLVLWESEVHKDIEAVLSRVELFLNS